MNLEDYDFDRLLGLGYTEKATGELKEACWKGYTAVGTKKKGGRTVPNCVPIKKSDHAEEMKRKPFIAGPSAGSPSFAEGEDETLDFTRCERPNGTAYGTGGKCRKGTESKAPVAPAPPKSAMTKKDPVAEVLKSQEELKKFNKEENKRLAKDKPELAIESLAVKMRKLSEEYKRLAGDPSQASRRKEIMDKTAELAKKQQELINKRNASVQGPQRKADTSPLANMRRASAAARAED